LIIFFEILLGYYEENFQLKNFQEIQTNLSQLKYLDKNKNLLIFLFEFIRIFTSFRIFSWYLAFQAGQNFTVFQRNWTYFSWFLQEFFWKGLKVQERKGGHSNLRKIFKLKNQELCDVFVQLNFRS